MTDELGKVEKPEAKQYEGKRKLYLVPLVYTYEGAPADYAEKYSLYWKQAQEHIRNLESKMGTVDLVYHESVTITGDRGLETQPPELPDNKGQVPVGCKTRGYRGRGTDRGNNGLGTSLYDGIYQQQGGQNGFGFICGSFKKEI